MMRNDKMASYDNANLKKRQLSIPSMSVQEDIYELCIIPLLQ